LMKDELLKEGPYNVIIVDWSDWNGFPYAQAVSNARVVGAHVGKLIRLLMENKGARAQSFHLIGHSLGGQVSGWAGERIPNLGRITGLGIDEPIGDLDFYPNGGKKQPGCFYQYDFNFTYGFVDPIEDYIANPCDHSRANYLFVDSINRCTFLAVQCESYDSFTSGKCEEKGPLRSIMGLRAQKIPELSGSRRFYLNTDDESPYCME
ncbi:hepatic triacylglycerol lipase, partial [Trichonephila inaurata madagascariensis]